MKRLLWVVLFLLASGGGIMWYLFWGPQKTNTVLSPILEIINRPLDTYTIDNLTKRGGKSSPIVFDQAVATESAYTEYTFHYESAGKKVTGLAHVPNDESITSRKPVIIQIRGFVDHAIYEPGVGTKHSAEVFAKNGYISLAPDYLGYGGSDNPSADVFEERFETYTATLDLLASLPSLPMADPSHVGIWAHSNGGQIALTVLEITKAPYPTVLWAPVTRIFPYSILYYTDEADDHGKLLRKELSKFESLYDTDLYAMTNYIDRITAPIQLHQGTADDAVPVKWSNEFVEALKAKNISVEYFVYPGSDHNLQPAWNTVMQRDLEFFRTRLK